MRDEKLVADLYAQCKAELVKVDDVIVRGAAYDRAGFPKKCKDLYEFRYNVLLMMERLATGVQPTPPTGKTSWDHVKKDDDE
jgi:hypothetical protein